MFSCSGSWFCRDLYSRGQGGQRQTGFPHSRGRHESRFYFIALDRAGPRCVKNIRQLLTYESITDRQETDAVTPSSVPGISRHAENIPYPALRTQMPGPRRLCSWGFPATRISGFVRARRASCNCSRLSLHGTSQSSEFLVVTLPRPAESAVLYASADITETLGPDECYVIKGSQAYVGSVAVPCFHLARVTIVKAGLPPGSGRQTSFLYVHRK